MIVLFSSILLSLVTLYVIILMIKMPKVHKKIDLLHKEFKLYRKKQFNSVRPVFCSTESEFNTLMEKAKSDIEISRKFEKTIPHSKMVFLSPFVFNVENFIKGDLKEHINIIRDFKERDGV